MFEDNPDAAPDSRLLLLRLQELLENALRRCRSRRR